MDGPRDYNSKVSQTEKTSIRRYGLYMEFEK